jgi:hypothetical protein
MKQIKLTAALLAAAAAMLVAFAPPAAATLQLSANINGAIFNCADQQACDTNIAVGQLAIADQTINGVRIVGSSQIAFAGGLNFLNTSSFQIVNETNAIATIILAISGVDFFGPANGFDASGSGTFQNGVGSTINISFYADPANAQGADNPLDLPGIQLATFADVAGTLADAFAFNDSGAFTSPGPFSMSLGTSGTLAAWNGLPGQNPTLVGRSQTLLIPQAVPEPSTLALLGLGLLACGFLRRRPTR